jgi:hypothetical protein
MCVYIGLIDKERDSHTASSDVIVQDTVFLAAAAAATATTTTTTTATILHVFTQNV